MKQIKNIKTTVSLILVFLPYFVFAQTGLRVQSLIIDFGGILSYMPGIIFGLAVIYFFWGTGQFILNAGDEKYRAEGKKRMFWSIIALFVFVSIYGIIRLLGQLVGFLPYPMP